MTGSTTIGSETRHTVANARLMVGGALPSQDAQMKGGPSSFKRRNGSHLLSASSQSQ